MSKRRKPDRKKMRLRAKQLTDPQKVFHVTLEDGPIVEQDLTWKGKIRSFIGLALQRADAADIFNTAKVIAYFTLLSIFPLIIFIGNLLPLMHLKVNDILAYVETAIPSSIWELIWPYANKLLHQSSGGLLSFGAIGTLWAASRGIYALKNSFNQAYGVAKEKNYFRNRFFSLVMTLVLVVIMMIVTVVFAFGQTVLELLTQYIKISRVYLHTFQTLKWPVMFVALFILLTMMYYFIPNARLKLRTVLPGALFTTIGWMALAQLFGLYVTYFGTTYSAYGTIGTFIVLLFWLNFSGIVLMLGAVLNAVTQELLNGKVHGSRSKVRDFIQKQQQKKNN
ncbi:hypothetical protein IV38_GL001344 [Lactobacillus selangorensis]|uniref:Uncharacterized protein n=1 Tax=Lactobacillus selangorensis TaxID=81857 RepID=A0A0R2G2Q9_9LACO|nr:YihY/virulence factor BrkB family protein [Lactobacillus selangorensis]KRN28345.1 hypothetical protein IV38_GL001344 [Lactobacillus selangorensis]KRN31847.1 hypothetical protein IV40_GL001131 [Lactobacillus selangorensis]